MRRCWHIYQQQSRLPTSGNNPEPIQAKAVQSAFPPGINVTGGRGAGTQVFTQFAVYYAIDVYTPIAYILT